jgi:hypothetical protein
VAADASTAITVAKRGAARVVHQPLFAPRSQNSGVAPAAARRMAATSGS